MPDNMVSPGSLATLAGFNVMFIHVVVAKTDFTMLSKAFKLDP